MVEITDMPICYGYRRWSSDEQSDGSSESRQTTDIEKFAAGHGMHLVWITDPGVSARDGYNLQHGQIAKLRSDILAGRRDPGMIAVAEPSRLSRSDEWDVLEFVAPLLNRGCTLGIASRNMILQKGDKEALMKSITFLFDQHGGHTENEKRVRSVAVEAEFRRKKLKRGVVYSARVHDWLVCPPVQKRGQFEREIMPNPERAAVLVEIFELAATGPGAVKIAAILNDRARTDQRYRPWRGERWTKDRVGNLLTDRAVLGEFQPHKVAPREDATANPATKHKRKPFKREPDGDPIPDYFPQVVSKDLWDRVQAAKNRRGKFKSGRPSRENVNLFAGLCFCGDCGSRMHLYGKNERGKNDYIRCPTKQDGGSCGHRTYYSVQRLERVWLRDGLAMLSRASDFAPDSNQLDRLVDAVEAGRQAVAKAKRRVENVQEQMPDADTPEMRAVVRATLREALSAVAAAETERDQAQRTLDIARGNSVSDALLGAELLTLDVEAGETEARLQFAQLTRTMVDRIEFKGGKAFVTPARPALPIPMVDDDGTYVEAPERPARRLIVEFLPGNRGRRVVANAERVVIEGMDARA